MGKSGSLREAISCSPNTRHSIPSESYRSMRTHQNMLDKKKKMLDSPLKSLWNIVVLRNLLLVISAGDEA